MNRHLAIKTSCFSVVKLRNSPAQCSVMARVPRLESECFNYNLHDPDLIRASLTNLRIKMSLNLLLALSLFFSTANLYAAPIERSKAANQQFTSKNFSHWLNAAYIAEATYKTKSDVKSVFSSQGYKLKQFKQLGNYAIAYALATNNKTKQHIIAVRGTSNIENVVADIIFELVADKHTGIDIHQGFLLSSRDIYNSVLPELNPEYKINTIGHSLGGASALILAMMLDAKGYSIDEIITFGQPKVTNISGSRKFSHLNIKRLVTEKDVVPLIPPLDLMDLTNLRIFWHQGTEIILFKNNQYAVLTGTDSMMRASDFLNDVPHEQHLKNHFMTTYISYLKNKLRSSEQVIFKSDFKISDWFSSFSKPVKE